MPDELTVLQARAAAEETKAKVLEAERTAEVAAQPPATPATPAAPVPGAAAVPAEVAALAPAVGPQPPPGKAPLTAADLDGMSQAEAVERMPEIDALLKAGA
jgi:hypothetical protein